LAVMIAEQVEKDQSKPVPVVTLGKSHYTHKSYGRIFTPVFELKEWVSMDGDADAEVDAEVEALAESSAEAYVEATQPTGRRRRAAS
jgi:hypothetical protein